MGQNSLFVRIGGGDNESYDVSEAERILEEDFKALEKRITAN